MSITIKSIAMLALLAGLPTVVWAGDIEGVASFAKQIPGTDRQIPIVFMITWVLAGGHPTVMADFPSYDECLDAATDHQRQTFAWYARNPKVLKALCSSKEDVDRCMKGPTHTACLGGMYPEGAIDGRNIGRQPALEVRR